MARHILVDEPFGKTVFPIRVTDRVGHPMIGLVVRDEKGWVAIPPNTNKYGVSVCRTRSEAIEYLRRIAG